MKYFDTTVRTILKEAGWNPTAGDLTSTTTNIVNTIVNPFLAKLSAELKSNDYINNLLLKLQYKITNSNSIAADPNRDNVIKTILKILRDRSTIPPENYQNRGVLPDKELEAFIEDKVPFERLDRLRIILAT
jgi:hypothetical protein